MIKKKIIVFFIITICSFGSENIFFTKENNIFMIKKNIGKIKQITKTNNISWGMNRSGNIGAYVEDVIKKDSKYGKIIIINNKTGNKIDELKENDCDLINPIIWKDKVIYLRIKEGEKDIYIYDTKKHKKTRLTYDGVSIYPVINYMREELYYQKYDGNKRVWVIMKYNLKKNKKKILLSGKNSYEYPEISKNGRYMGIEERVEDKTYISLYNLETKKMKRITFLGDERYINFRDDSKEIIYLSKDSIYRYNIEKELKEKLFSEKINYLNIIVKPQWLNKKEIIYEYRIGVEKWEMRIYNIETKKNRKFGEGKIVTLSYF
ncbi:MAG: hypothetical protein B6I28_00950 [Fusobacteriia bacterium 4572_132]|nr:MAG: hypothetical protein B6I28_00950 [Fusobacteriia bacterium 4572_132]